MFDPSSNASDACQFHPGGPIFHDALKGWSCCNKKSTDFTQFLNIPGCTRSFHSNEKPPEPEKPPKDESAAEVIVYQAPRPQELTARPTSDENIIELPRHVQPSLVESLLKAAQNAANSANNTTEKSDSNLIPLGTPCKNPSCQARYQGEQSNSEECTYHSGVAIFHEGMKYWSCCQRKTSDFNSFLSQAGCTTGSHLWFKEEPKGGERVDCRYDFHQTGGFVIVTIYSKNPVPEKTSIKASSIRLEINVAFEAGTKSFVKSIDLYGVVKLNESIVNFYQSKVEIKLKKADPISWAKLDYSPPKKA